MHRALRIVVICYVVSGGLLAGQTHRPRKPKPQPQPAAEAPTPPARPVAPGYEALRGFLQQRQTEAKARNVPPGFADQLLAQARNLDEQAEPALDSLYKELQEADLRDRGFAAEITQETDRDAAFQAVKGTWTALTGRALWTRFLALTSREFFLQPPVSFRQRFYEQIKGVDLAGLSNSELRRLDRQRIEAMMKDLGFAVELNDRLPATRIQALPKEQEKWERLEGSALKDEFQNVLRRYLRERQKEAQTKKTEQLGMADQLLIRQGEMGPSFDPGNLYGRFLEAQQLDDGLAMDLSLQPPESRVTAEAGLKDKWRNLGGRELKEEYAKVVRESLLQRQREARTKRALEVGFAIRLVRDVGSINDMAGEEVEKLYDAHHDAQRCDAALEYLKPSPQQPR